MAQSIPKRSEVPAELTWDVYSVFASDEAWEEAIGQVQGQVAAIAKFQGTLAQGATRLADCVTATNELVSLMEKVWIYASMFHEVDTADQAAAAKVSRAGGLWAQVAAGVSFIEPEMLAIGLDTIKTWLSADDRLAIYEHYLDTLARRQAHVRSAEVEEVLGQLSDAFQTAQATHGLLANADLKFPPAAGDREVAQGSIDLLLMNADREVRRTAFENYADKHLAYKNTMANAMSAGVKQHVFLARARRHESSLAAALSGNHLPRTVYDNTLETFQRHLPTWHRYWRVLRRGLGYEKLHVYDIKAPYTQKKTHIPLEQAMTWIKEGLAPLGDEYVQIMDRGVTQERWVDSAPNQNKSAGAFSSGTQGIHPFILMSYVNDVESLSTLAHELGHSMHSYYSWKNQPYLYHDYTIFVAEVASNFNQALVRHYLLETMPDKDFQLALLEEAMSNFHRYFFLMPTLARFELAVHEQVERGEGLTADGMNELMFNLFAEGYGDELVLDKERIGCTWSQFHTHLYYDFYVYQYTTGIAGAHALAEKVLAGEPGVVDNYLSFLKAGGSMYSLDILKMAGVDMSTPEAVEMTYGVLSKMVDRIAELMGVDNS